MYIRYVLLSYFLYLLFEPIFIPTALLCIALLAARNEKKRVLGKDLWSSSTLSTTHIAKLQGSSGRSGEASAHRVSASPTTQDASDKSQDVTNGHGSRVSKRFQKYQDVPQVCWSHQQISDGTSPQLCTSKSQLANCDQAGVSPNFSSLHVANSRFFLDGL